MQDNSLDYVSNAWMLGPKQIGPNILLSRDSSDPLNLFRLPRSDVRNVSGGGKTTTGAAAATGHSSHLYGTHASEGGGDGAQAWGNSGQEGNRSHHDEKSTAQHASDGADDASEGVGNNHPRITVIPVRRYCQVTALLQQVKDNPNELSAVGLEVSGTIPRFSCRYKGYISDTKEVYGYK